MQTLELPDKLAKRLESFKRLKGRKWTTELDELLKRETARAEFMTTVRQIRARNKHLTEEEVLRRLEE
jgi:hypothetical protein